MSLLLDTHALLWFLALDARLSAKALAAVRDPLTANDIHVLPIEVWHIEPLSTLPLHHRDPFDRLLAATALVEGLAIVSSDVAFDLYGLSRVW